MRLVPTPLKRACALITRGSAPTYAEDGEAAVATVIGQSCQRPDGSFDVGFAKQQAPEGGVPAKGRVFGGEVLINSTGTGTLGRVAMIRDPVSVATFVDSHVTLLRVRPDRADARFVVYLLGLPARREYIEDALSFGATKQRELSTEALRSYVLRLPGARTQRVVADFLDRECGRVSRAQVSLERLTILRQEYEQVTLTEAFEQDNGAGRTRLRRVLLESPCYGVLVPRFVEGAGVPFIRVGDLAALGEGPLATISDDQSTEYQRTIVSPGDLLVSVVGSIDKAAIVPSALSGANIARAVARLRPLPSVPSELLFAWTRTASYLRQARLATSHDTAQPTLNVGDLSGFTLYLPATAEARHRLAHRTSEIIRQSRELAVRMARQKAMLAQYRDALITEAVTGKLDVSNLSDAQLDESARAALEGEAPEVLAS